MLRVTYRLKLGQDDFQLEAEVKSEKEFFETMSFYASLPRTGPNGEDDLRIQFRTTTEGHKYYSLVSDKAGYEFMFGQNLDKNGGGLFPKGWQALYVKNNEGQQTQQQAPAPAAAPAKKAAAPKLPQNLPNLANANFPGMVNPATGPSAAATAAPTPAAVAPTPAPTPAAAPAAPVVSPQVKAVSNDVLARFGINKT